MLKTGMEKQQAKRKNTAMVGDVFIRVSDGHSSEKGYRGVIKHVKKRVIIDFNGKKHGRNSIEIITSSELRKMWEDLKLSEKNISYIIDGFNWARSSSK